MRIGSIASETPAKLQSDLNTLNADLAPSWLCEILFQEVLCDIDNWPLHPSPLEPSVPGLVTV